MGAALPPLCHLDASSLLPLKASLLARTANLSGGLAGRSCRFILGGGVSSSGTRSSSRTRLRVLAPSTVVCGCLLLSYGIAKLGAAGDAGADGGAPTPSSVWVVLADSVTEEVLIDVVGAPAPHFALSLDRVSFLTLNRILGERLALTPGGIGFEVEIQSRARPDLQAEENGREAFWLVRTRSRELVEFFQSTTYTRSRALLARAESGELTVSETTEIVGATKLLGAIDDALRFPTYDLVVSDGALARSANDDGRFWLVADGAAFELTEPEHLRVSSTGLLESLLGNEVVVRGYMEEPGRVALQYATEKQTNTLEVFIMSHCPFAQKLLLGLAPYLRLPPDERGFEFEVHYVFYEDDGEIRTMHGPAEQEENAIQMRVRDIFPEFYLDFLFSRLAHPEIRWRDHAREVGLGVDQIVELERAQANDEARIDREIRYVRDRNGVADGSPTFYWESRFVAINKNFEPLTTLGYVPSLIADETCHQ